MKRQGGDRWCMLPGCMTLLIALMMSGGRAVAADCNNNGIPDDQDLANGTSADVDGDGIPDECGFSLPPKVNDAYTRSSRYLEFDVPPTSGDPNPPLEVLRVRVVSLGGFDGEAPEFLYVGMPHIEASKLATPNTAQLMLDAPLQCEPFEYAWGNILDTFGVYMFGVSGWWNRSFLFVYGAEIVPGSTYEVQRSLATCPYETEPGCWTEPLTLTTVAFGDTDYPFAGEGGAQPDYTDVADQVGRFLGNRDESKWVSQLQPNIVFPDRSVDFNDIAEVVDAFLGASYFDLHSGPCTCPSTVTCGTTACSSDGDCAPGLCIDNFCRDACGRCSP